MVVPFGRIAQQAEIAEGVVWLLSDQASYINATVMRCGKSLAPRPAYPTRNADTDRRDALQAPSEVRRQKSWSGESRTYHPNGQWVGIDEDAKRRNESQGRRDFTLRRFRGMVTRV